MGFFEMAPKEEEQINERKHLRSSDNKLDIYYFQLGLYISSHAWDQRSQFYSALCGEQTILHVVPIPPTHQDV